MENERKTFFADILLPLPLPALFTYRIPHEMEGQVAFGQRVIVPFGRSKLYSGLVVKVHENAPKEVIAKYVLDIMDERPVVAERQFRLWQWMAQYYMCTLGEVMAAALPSALKLASETKIRLHPNFDGDVSALTPKELMIAEALANREALTIEEVGRTARIQKAMPVINSLVEKKIVITDEELRNPYKPKTETFIRIVPPYNEETAFMSLIDRLNASARTAPQADMLLSFMMLNRKGTQYDFKAAVPKEQVLKAREATPSRLQTLVKKHILESETKVISRLVDISSCDIVDNIRLSGPQETALAQIKRQFDRHPVVLLHGVTGSGKTEIYIKLIDSVLAQGRQVLYLLPEIALTSQIVNRLRKYFGEKVGVYHSRFNEYERVEIWNRVIERAEADVAEGKYQLVLGARSALLLPYKNLGLVIVDEEHDASYKQQDPAPRYQARDCAIMLGQIHKAKVLLGTATPSLESYHNAMQKKYGLVTLGQRFADSRLPDIWTVNMAQARKNFETKGVFSDFLIAKMQEALDKKEQIILFQNRRGYAVRMICHACQYMPVCRHCDVTLTYHKKTNLLKCHYCGYAIEVPHECPSCHSTDIGMRGFGTEKVEDTLAEIFPEARVARMDFDSTRSKNAYQQIISDFEQHKTDILVGTQMVTKGLDFDRVTVVGILDADSLISFPDFRAFERAFQLLSQVSGRAGRKEVPGKVIIQTYQPSHPAIQYVTANDFAAMYESQMQEREEFRYPPVTRLIKISLKHPDEQVVCDAALALAQPLQASFKGWLLGPEAPLVSRVQNYFIRDFWLKLPKNAYLEQKKQLLVDTIRQFQQDCPEYRKVRMVINVDA